MKSLLKWAGGKRWLAPHLGKVYREKYHNCRVVEPFVGGLSVALKLRSKEALLNDINPHLINFYRQVKLGAFELKRQLPNEKEYYYQRREEFNKLIKAGGENSLRSAELFYYLNKHGFNGLCRFNSDGKFNVPFGARTSIEIPKSLQDYIRVFQAWNFSCQDFSNIEIRSGDFLYIDPPYDNTFTKYSKEDFNWDDQTRLAEWFSNHDGPLIISNSWTERVVELYKSLGLKVSEVQAPRSISRDADGRGQVSEVLATRDVNVFVDQGVFHELFNNRACNRVEGPSEAEDVQLETG